MSKSLLFRRCCRRLFADDRCRRSGLGGIVLIHSTGQAPEKPETPGFDLKRAYHRITHLVVLAAVMMVLVTVLVIRFTTDALTLGYLFGLILAFAPRIKEMTPNNQKNQKKFEHVYADCYPSGKSPRF